MRVPKIVQIRVGIRYFGFIIISVDISIARFISTFPSDIIIFCISGYDIIVGIRDSASWIINNIKKNIIVVIKIFFEAVDFFDSSNIPQFNFTIITSAKFYTIII
jgi:hypothetical protein